MSEKKTPAHYRIARLTFAAGSVFLLVTTTVGAAPFEDIFIFGDSFSDTGNVYATTWHFYPPDPPFYQGRFSDGPVWVEYAAGELGLTVIPNGRDPWVIQGNNFAFGGARAGVDVPYWPFGDVPSLRTQTHAFIAGAAPLSADAFYLAYCGGNDVLFATDPANGFTPPEQDQIIQDAVADVVASISNLANAGAKRFLIPNMADWGSTPLARFVNSNSLEVTEVSIQFNDLLAPSLTSLATTLGIVIVQFDAFALNQQIIDDALHHGGAVFGITNVDVPIFEGYAGSPGADPTTSLFADDLHWSTVAHEVFSDAALDAVARSAMFFADCLSGPSDPCAPGCDLVDFNADNDVDLRDYADFAQDFTGPSE